MNPASPFTAAAVSASQEPSHDLDAGQALQDLLRKPQTALPPPGQAIVIGELLEVREGAAPRVQWPQGPAAGVAAISLVALSESDRGASVALSFAAGSSQPVILGLVWNPAGNERLRVELDGEHLELTAQQSLTLRCGQASITLTADGQVLLRGTYVSSHSTGTQRIKGAAVRIN